MNNYSNNNYDNNNYDNNNYSNNNYDYNNYETNTNKKPLSYYIKRFLLAFLFIVIVIFLLLWIFPTKSALNPFYDKIFGENINTMKEVAIAYYTTERLPKDVGDTKRLTLGQMLDMKLLLEIKDKNGDMCDVDDSYVELTKLDNEYKMKVNLKCGEQEDYIIVYLGCYDYCLNDICEKQDTTSSTNKNSTTNKNTTTTVVKKPEKHYCAIVNGKYYDNNGKVVSKQAYEKACKSKPTKHYCAIVNGKYYDDKGNVVSKSEYKKACTTVKPAVYKYLYKKEVSVHYDKVYSKWSDWSSNIEYNPNTDNISWGKHEYVWYEKNGSKTTTTTKLVVDKTKPIYQTRTVKMGTYSRWVCSGYDYFINSTTNTLYQTNGWTYQGIVELSYIPSDTNTAQYIYVDMYYENCNNDICSIKPVYKFKKYTRSASTVTQSKEELEAVCKVEKRDIDVYATVYDDFVAYQKKQVKESTTKYYYHKKTRTLIRDEYTDKKVYKVWSYDKNDSSLIAQGYKYTGIYEKVS